MDDETIDFWQNYVRQLADLLGLKDWIIEVMRDYPDGNHAYASVNVIEGQREAVIRFQMDWPLGVSLEEQRYVVCHELLHAHMEPIQDRVKMASREFGDNSLMKVLPEMTHVEIEYAIDAIGRVISQYLPLPNIERGI